ncbi:MAG TPA: hypothetical protein VHA52_01950 [Candidatus Babeliaceae bacterium]|nr:hypothetical protein [Candidatus Babeliaceae bacterium]
MRNSIFCASTIMLVVLLSACSEPQPQDIIGQAYETYTRVHGAYYDFKNNNLSLNIIEKARAFGVRNHLSIGSAIWESLWGREYLSASEGTPLHRAVYFMEYNNQELDKQAYNLERNLLVNHPIYQDIINFRHFLCTLIIKITADPAYTEETQFIEGHKLQKKQLVEARNQTQMLHNLSNKPQVNNLYQNIKVYN